MGIRDWVDQEIFIKGIKAYIGFNALMTLIAILLIGIERGDVGGNYGAFFLLFGAMLVGIGMVFGMISGLFFDFTLTEYSKYPFQMRDVVSNGLFTYEQFSTGVYLIGIAYVIGIALTVLAAMYVGRKAYNAKIAFGTWFIISTLGAIFGLIGRSFGFITLYVEDFMWFGLAIVVNGLVFGAIAAIAVRKYR